MAWPSPFALGPYGTPALPVWGPPSLLPPGHWGVPPAWSGPPPPPPPPLVMGAGHWGGPPGWSDAWQGAPWPPGKGEQGYGSGQKGQKGQPKAGGGRHNRSNDGRGKGKPAPKGGEKGEGKGGEQGEQERQGPQLLRGRKRQREAEPTEGEGRGVVFRVTFRGEGTLSERFRREGTPESHESQGEEAVNKDGAGED